MKDIITLFRLDGYRLRNWFRTNSGIKLLVALGFLLAIVGIGLLEYFLSYSFFLFTSTQEEFGKAITTYSINASMLILFIFSFASSLASTSKGFFRPGFLRTAFSSPISATRICIARFASTLVPSTMLLVLLFFPVFMSYANVYSLSIEYFLRCLVVLLVLCSTSHAMGGAVALISATIHTRASLLISKSIIFISFSTSLFMGRFLFPNNFFTLYNAQNWQEFQNQLGKLPLLSTYLPTNWLATTITKGWSMQSLVAIGVSLLAIVLFLLLAKNIYRKAWIIQNQGNTLAAANTGLKIKQRQFPNPFPSKFGALVTNEILAIIRSQGEMNYLAFLLGLSTVLTFLVQNIPGLEQVKPEYLPVVKTMVLLGFSYLGMTVAARYVYPQMAKEKKTSWLLFSIPLDRKKILFSKMAFALLIGLPNVILGVIAAISANFIGQVLLAYVVLLLLVSAYVSIVNLLFGTISPNFDESENPEATSTSGSGMAAVVVSLLAITVSGFTFFLILSGYLQLQFGLALVFGSFAFTLIPTSVIAINNLEKYNI